MAESGPGGGGIRGLKAELSLFDSVTIVAGSMIGSAIFIVSADIARHVGSPAALLAVWIAAGLMTIAGALAYGELAAMMPQAGGQYVYLREAYGGLPAFLFGWTLLLGSRPAQSRRSRSPSRASAACCGRRWAARCGSDGRGWDSTPSAPARSR